MPSPAVVIAQSDPRTAQGLAKDLHAHFSKVAVAQSAVELQTLLRRHEAQVAVLDMEIVNLEEVRKLTEMFDDLAIICTHRSPDERMWMAALNAGAVNSAIRWTSIPSCALPTRPHSAGLILPPEARTIPVSDPRRCGDF